MMLQKNLTDKHTFSFLLLFLISCEGINHSFILSMPESVSTEFHSQMTFTIETYSLVTPLYVALQHRVLRAVMFWCKVQVNPKTKCVTQTGKISTSVECVSEPLICPALPSCSPTGTCCRQKRQLQGLNVSRPKHRCTQNSRV